MIRVYIWVDIYVIWWDILLQYAVTLVLFTIFIFSMNSGGRQQLPCISSHDWQDTVKLLLVGPTHIADASNERFLFHRNYMQTLCPLNMYICIVHTNSFIHTLFSWSACSALFTIFFMHKNVPMLGAAMSNFLKSLPAYTEHFFSLLVSLSLLNSIYYNIVVRKTCLPSKQLPKAPRTTNESVLEYHKKQQQQKPKRK